MSFLNEEGITRVFIRTMEVMTLVGVEPTTFELHLSLELEVQRAVHCATEP